MSHMNAVGILDRLTSPVRLITVLLLLLLILLFIIYYYYSHALGRFLGFESGIAGGLSTGLHGFPFPSFSLSLHGFPSPML